MTDGVRADLLCCPTCGAAVPPRVHRDERESFMAREPTRIEIGPMMYVDCVNGHRWSVKTLTRFEHGGDFILLDRYLGQYDAPWDG